MKYLSNCTKEELYNLTINKKIELIQQNKYLNVFINDPDWSIRQDVAKQGYGLDKLINDKSWIVRQEVAYKGYDLDILINDENEYVKQTVVDYCISHPEKQECKDILNLYNL